MRFKQLLNVLNFVFLRVTSRLKNNKKPTPLKIAQLPQILTEIDDIGVSISRGPSPALKQPLWAQFPESLTYCRFPKNGFNGISTVLTGVYSRLNTGKTKKVLSVQKSKISQPRFSTFFIFSREVTRRYAKKMRRIKWL